MAIYQLDALTPQMADSAWVADNAQVMGDVHMAADSSVWFSSVVRGDSATIFIGEGSNIPDGSLVTEGKEFPDGSMILGTPAKVVRQLTTEQMEGLRRSAQHYVNNKNRFKAGLKKLV